MPKTLNNSGDQLDFSLADTTMNETLVYICMCISNFLFCALA